MSYFFQNDDKHGKTIKFYASAPSLHIEIFSDNQIDCNYEEVCRFIDAIYDNTEENFFTLENEAESEDEAERCIQFFNDGKSEIIEIDIPVSSRQGSYKGEFSSLSNVKNCVRSFFNKVDISFDYPVKFEKW